MNYQTLRDANVVRQQEWDPYGKASNMAWRLNELGGEVGEVCNILKKIHRERMNVPGSRATKCQLAEELADVVICIDLAAMEAGCDEIRILNVTPPILFDHLPEYGVVLLSRMGRVCAQPHDHGGPLALLLDAVYALANREGINIEMAVAAKFNATSAKTGLRTTLRLDPSDVGYEYGVSQY